MKKRWVVEEFKPGFSLDTDFIAREARRLREFQDRPLEDAIKTCITFGYEFSDMLIEHAGADQTLICGGQRVLTVTTIWPVYRFGQLEHSLTVKTMLHDWPKVKETM